MARKQSAPTIPAPKDEDLRLFEARLAKSESYARLMHLGAHMHLHEAVAESQRARWGHE